MEAKDPSSGASYYYNESTGNSQWERPAEISSTTQSPSALPLLEDWIEALDETTGMLCALCIFLPLLLCFFINVMREKKEWGDGEMRRIVVSSWGNT